MSQASRDKRHQKYSARQLGQPALTDADCRLRWGFSASTLLRNEGFSEEVPWIAALEEVGLIWSNGDHHFPSKRAKSWDVVDRIMEAALVLHRMQKQPGQEPWGPRKSALRQVVKALGLKALRREAGCDG